MDDPGPGNADQVENFEDIIIEDCPARPIDSIGQILGDPSHDIGGDRCDGGVNKLTTHASGRSTGDTGESVTGMLDGSTGKQPRKISTSEEDESDEEDHITNKTLPPRADNIGSWQYPVITPGVDDAGSVEMSQSSKKVKTITIEDPRTTTESIFRDTRPDAVGGESLDEKFGELVCDELETSARVFETSAEKDPESKQPRAADVKQEDEAGWDIENSLIGNNSKGKQSEEADASQRDQDEGDYCSPNSTPPPRADEVDRWQHHINLQECGKRLHQAAQAVFPNDTSSRYRNVYVLMLKWKDEDPQLPVSYDIPKLWDVFNGTCGFDTELWEIPDDDKHCHRKVAQKIIDFSMLGGDSRDDLKILYYAGHGKITKNRTLSWTRYAITNYVDLFYPNLVGLLF